MCVYKYQVRIEDGHYFCCCGLSWYVSCRSILVLLCIEFITLVRMVLSDYIKLRILSLHWQGFKISKIADILVLEDATVVTKPSIRLFLKRFTERGTIARKPGSGLTLKLSPTILQIIESTMQEDDETTATQLQAKLAAHGCYVSLTTILRNPTWMGLSWFNLLSTHKKGKQTKTIRVGSR